MKNKSPLLRGLLFFFFGGGGFVALPPKKGRIKIHIGVFLWLGSAQPPPVSGKGD